MENNLDHLKSENYASIDALNVYQYGSRVYGTHNDNSDYDMIVVVPEIKPVFDGDKSINMRTAGVDYTIYGIKEFQDLINEHEISALECLFLSTDKVVKDTHKFDFTLDLSKLRHSLSTKSSNSWVKAKKKLTVKKDFDRGIALKSLFHSLRIPIFGIQIAKHGKIVDYTSANHFYQQMLLYSRSDWEFYKNKYQPIYNSIMSEFRKVAPK